MTNSYKTVLVHVNDERRADRLIAYAAEFAEAQGAHLIGLYVVPLPVVLNEWPDVAVAEMMETQRKAYREEGKRIAQKFRDKTKLMSKPAEWRQVESPYASVDQGVVQNARSADIVLAAQPDKSWHLTGTLDAAETAIMESGRPVLVIPNSGALSPSPKRVMIAWNGRRNRRVRLSMRCPSWRAPARSISCGSIRRWGRTGLVICRAPNWPSPSPATA